MSLDLLERPAPVAHQNGEPVAIAPEAPPFVPNIYVAWPMYGDVCWGSARAIHNPGFILGDNINVIATQLCSSSATPHTFNSALCTALDLRDKGVVDENNVEHRVTHFAMLHSDVAPKNPGWLPTLYREMALHKADMIAAVIPIKEPERSRTSTAVGNLDNIWEAKRYVRLQHRELLPLTFGPEDLLCQPNEVMLINTGCMLLDLRHPWIDDFAFEFRTRIVKKTAPDGKVWRQAQLASEDWLLSRLVQANGGRVCATWAVPLVHKGFADWSNDE